MTKQNELNILENFNRARVAVLGDMMLDVYIWGQVNRISPEAPVPVVSVQKRTSCLGGAANVMRNIATLGAHAEGFGVIGSDEAGQQVIAELENAGILPDGVFAVPDRPTTEKRRIMASGQQLLRIDEENISPVPDDIRRKLVNNIIDRIRSGKIDVNPLKGAKDACKWCEFLPVCKRRECEKRDYLKKKDLKPEMIYGEED